MEGACETGLKKNLGKILGGVNGVNLLVKLAAAAYRPATLLKEPLNTYFSRILARF